jgi:hypothetical protein
VFIGTKFKLFLLEVNGKQDREEVMWGINAGRDID